jgi:hypothetical protein
MKMLNTKTYRRVTPAYGSTAHSEYTQDWVVEGAVMGVTVSGADMVVARRVEARKTMALAVLGLVASGSVLMVLALNVVNAVVR